MSEQELQHKPANDQASEAPVQMTEEAGDQTKFSGQGQLPPVAGGAGVAQVSASDRGYGAEKQTHAIADQAVADGGGSMPYVDEIAQSFGEHGDKVRGIRAHTGKNAKQATGALGAQAFAYGNDVAFADKPSLHTAAHEAAHVVQQHAGIATKMKVGEPGDAHEKEADAVADRVVAGQSASDLLQQHATKGDGGGEKAVQSKAVQFLGTPLGEKLPDGAEKPAWGEDVDQRRYSREQYEHMWEAEQGHKLGAGEKSTIERGCIGISANNIAGGGNPLDFSEANFDNFDFAHKYMEMKNKELAEMRAKPETAHLAPAGGEYILFAKQFWSNQKDEDGANTKPDDTAFKGDPKTHRMDMSGYQYKAQPGFVNFDYGFWDDNSNAFWHANHMEYKDPDKKKKDPMKVFQSTKEHFIAGYTDFDRVVFGVAFAKNYDPGKAAINSRAGH